MQNYPTLQSRTPIMKITFRSFMLWYSPETGQCSWYGPKPWESAIKLGVKSWVQAGGFAGMELVAYLDALDIGRNNPSREAKKKVQ